MSTTEHAASEPPQIAEGLATRLAREAARARMFGSPKTPIRIGRHVVIEAVGSGAMGAVYAAYDPNLDRKIAVKVVLGGRGAGAERQSRLVREAQALAKLSHPNVVHVYDTGTHDGDVYIAMEFIRGRPLTAWMEDGPHTCDETVRVFVDAGRGLAAAHKAGLVHRDFKPDNVVLCADGRVVVLDFGLSSADENEPPEDLAASLEITAREGDTWDLTETGTVLGTPAYMSPEQFGGASADAKSDQFAYCVALFEALYGVRPFEGTTIDAVAANVCEGVLRDVSPPRPVPGWLRAACLRGLSTDPKERFESLEALLQVLRRHRTSPAKRLAQVAGVGLVAVVATVAVVNGSATAPPEAAPCEFDDDPWEGAWDSAARDAVRSAFAGTEASYADFAWATASETLDAFTADWEAMRSDACLATHVRGDQSSELLDRRMACLARRRDEGRVVAQLLADADISIVRNVPSLLGELGPLERCADAEYLEARVRPPQDPEVAAEVDALRHRLTEIRSQRVAGRAAAAVVDARAVQARAQALDYLPLRAEAGFALGDVQEARGELDEARDLYTAAFWDAADSGHDEMLLQIANDLAYVLGVSMTDTEPALGWLRHAESAVARGSGDDMDRAYVRVTRASLRLQTGETEAARVMLEEILVELKQAGAEPSKLAAVYTNLGAVYTRLDRTDDAAQAHEKAAAMALEAFGPEHPEYSKALANRAAMLDAGGDQDGAAQVLARALKINEGAFPDGHVTTVFMLTTLGTIAVHRDELAEACVRFARAYEVLETLADEHPRLLGMLLSNWAEALVENGAWEEGERRYREAIALDIEVLGPDHSERAWALGGLAESLAERKLFAEAIELLEEANRVRAMGDVPEQLRGASELLLARVLWRSEIDRPRARKLAAAAQKHLPSPEVSSVEAWLEEEF